MKVGPPRPPDGPLPDLDSREHIDAFVRDFYRHVAMDDLLGPVFAGFGVDWSHHVPKLIDFWCWQLLGERGYEGNPLRAHEPVAAQFPFEPRLYVRWLSLFESTVDAAYAGPRAEAAKARAVKMAGALERLLRGVSAPGSESVEPFLALTKPLS